MKLKYMFMAAAMCLGMTSCSEEELNPESIFESNETMPENDFDRWLKTNYVDEYNIQVKYRFEFNESDKGYNLVPAEYDKAVAIAKLTKYLWLDAYAKVMGNTFIRTYCPKLIHLVGSPQYNTDGSVSIGVAEGGMKITLCNINSLDFENLDIDFLNYWYFHTMHHEFTHILHQTKDYPTIYKEVTPTGYTSQSWVNLSNQQALDRGFITPYASMNTDEDLCEMLSTYVTHTQKYWDDTVAKASDSGKAAIASKLDILRGYMEETWGMDIDALREEVLERQEHIDELDLKSLN